MKDLKIEEPKPKALDPKPVSNSSSNVETFKKARKGSKKRFQKGKHKKKNFSSSTPATGGNTISNKVGPKGPKNNLFEIIYYNCNKKAYYSRTCLKPKKDNAPKN